MGTLDCLEKIRLELRENVDEKYKKDSERFFKEEVKTYGVRTPFVRKIARQYFKGVRDLDKGEIFRLCEDLFGTSYSEETTIAIQWIGGIKDRWEEEDFLELEKLFGYVDNWGKCDDFCLNVLSHFIVRFPKFMKDVKLWAKSDNRWKRRASAVGFIQGGSWRIHENYLNDVFEVANVLLVNEDDLVQKGYGWMLKVAADTHRDEVFDFVMERKGRMPRVSLRYAIEKMPVEMRKRAMARD